MKTIKAKEIFKISDKNKFIETLEFGKICIAFSGIKNIPQLKNFIVSENFAVIETENEALAVTEYFQSFDLKKDREFYDFYCNKKIKPLIENLLKKQKEEK